MRISAVPAAIALVATAIVAICVFNGLARIGERFPGFLLWDNLYVAAVGRPSWTGVASGVRYQSWLVAVEGRPVADTAAVEAEIGDRRAGDPVTYTFERANARTSVTVPLMRLAAPAWTAVFGIYLLNAVVLLLLGVSVLYLKPNDPAAFAMFLFSTNLSLYMATSADLFGPYVFRPAYFFFLNWIPATVFLLLSHFPVERARHRFETLAAAGLGVLGAALAVASNAAFHRDHAAALALDGITHMLLAAAGLGAIVYFCAYFLRASSALVRARTGVVLLGTIGAFTPPVVVLSLMYGLGVPLPLNYVTFTFVLFPLGIGYAIARLDLFDIDRIIRRTLAYALLSALVLIAYALTINVINHSFENLTALGSRLAEGIVVLALILVTSPSRERIQDFVDRVYDRHRYNYRDVVRSTSRTFATILDFETLVTEALRLIDATLQPTTAKLYSVPANGSALAHGALRHVPASAPQLTATAAGVADPGVTAVRAALTTSALVSLSEARERERDANLARELSGCGAAFAAAMKLEGRVVGFLLIGPKRSGLHYTSDDHELCHTICDQLAVALKNAQAYETIDLLNDDLERKNVALETANRELRNAQDELVRKERLAALGELSGAVAHAIRNPLAGIKAAAQLAALDLEDHPSAESLHDVISEADRLDGRIGALLQFSKPFEPSFRQAKLAAVIEQAIRDTSSKATARRVTVHRDLDNNEVELEMDPILMEQAILELVSNAIDASPEGGTVEVYASRPHERPERVRVEVADSGQGINERAAARLFDLFYTTKAKGTGFGLATVRKIVEAHGGTISVKNRPQGGASFCLDLPVKAGHAAQLERSPYFSSR